ncbi:MAG: DUF3109 family protein [Dysgonamonadaceae bacterium]|jgi:hypothetical protein|nr:DUF3109 family protein [Dysgonamonadaceae bacterium]
MIQIEDTIVSLDVIEEMFFCDLSVCKGICCVEGESGAPLEEEELPLLREALPYIWNDLSPEAQNVIEKQGVAYLDEDNEYVTSIVDGKDCVFTCYDETGICKCAIEKAYREGKISFYKPVSCHLYPVRVAKYKGFRAVNYHRWSVCQAAVALGKSKNLKVYQFLREPLIRKFGEEWYKQLDEVSKISVK